MMLGQFREHYESGAAGFKHNCVPFVEKKKNGKPIMSIPERTKVHREGKKQRDRKALVTLEVNRTALLDQRVSACGLHQRHPDCG